MYLPCISQVAALRHLLERNQDLEAQNAQLQQQNAQLEQQKTEQQKTDLEGGGAAVEVSTVGGGALWEEEVMAKLVMSHLPSMY